MPAYPIFYPLRLRVFAPLCLIKAMDRAGIRRGIRDENLQVVRFYLY